MNFEKYSRVKGSIATDRVIKKDHSNKFAEIICGEFKRVKTAYFTQRKNNGEFLKIISKRFVIV